MVEITEGIFVNKDEVCSIQEEKTVSWHGSPSDSFPVDSFVGSVITMKNGRKIYVKNLSPKEIMVKLNE
jgi:hypothetical protein